MLVDAFLAASDVRERYAMFLPHKHKIREPDSVPDYGSDKDSYNSKSGYQTSTKTNESSDDKLEGTTLNIENHLLDIGTKTSRTCSSGDLIYICHEKLKHHIYK
mmetsp:Transcript_14678/g.17118  ORF Transcript_14678/g.17118 Transcript_14678/m.17118 type:complete len:104 (-) Transcript_14678:1300-1611(-)